MTSRSLKTFVSHKVAEIQQLTNVNDWRHVPTNDNPADPLSRGLMPSQLKECSLWWKGPQFLLKPEEEWPKLEMNSKTIEVPEVKAEVHNIMKVESCELISLFSSYRKLIRLTAMILRFYYNLKYKILMKKNSPMQETDRENATGRISVIELNWANIRLIKLVQQEAFTKDYNDLIHKRDLNIKSSLLRLAPFLDKNGILRVGGRLTNSLLSYNQKHPIILPSSHHFTQILIRSYHEDNLHSGTQFTLNFVRGKYWILSGRNAVKFQIISCVKCMKMKPKAISQFMGDIPEYRLRPVFPFQDSFVDYCGYFWIKANPRGTVKSKGYVAVFQCATTRAIHLELASDLSTDCFLNCLYRFVGRRGEVSDLRSDNGTNFKGANNKLHELYELFQSQQHSDQVLNWCDRKQVRWHFIPPQCPHMGGTWESAVKLTKTLLVKYLSDAFLTYEEFNTVLIRIEAVLNSRPITALYDDPLDLNALTPGHFIIGRPLNELVEPDLGDLKMSRLSRFQYLTKLKQDVWKRWTQQYLHQLQMRFKWHKKIKVRVGQMVIVREDNVPSCEWILGRIVNLHPGSDGVVRVVTVKTKNGEIVRHLARLCYLPISDNELNEDSVVDDEIDEN